MTPGISELCKCSSSVYDAITASFLSPKICQFMQHYDFDKQRADLSLRPLRYRVFILTAFGQWVDLVYRVGFYLRQFIIETGHCFIFNRVEDYKRYQSVQAMVMAYIFRTLSICVDIVKTIGYSAVIISLAGESFLFHPLKAALRLHCLYDKLNGVSSLKLINKTSDELSLIQQESRQVQQMKVKKCVETPFSGHQFLTELDANVIPDLQSFLNRPS